jgi:hypothetical protein
MKPEIKVGYCIAYDWHLLKYAIPTVYACADTICLSVDKEKRTWSGAPFIFDDFAFRSFVTSIDPQNKIFVYEDDFSLPNLSPARNEVRQRRMMAEKMGDGGWHIQLDCDEYFLDFNGFVNYLRSTPIGGRPFNVCCPLVTIIKQIDSGFLFVRPRTTEQLEFIQIASSSPSYEHGRRNSQFNVFTNFAIVHQSWARSEDEIVQKLKSWGHARDFNHEVYLTFWRSLTEKNFQQVHDFHPTSPKVWPALGYQKAASIEEFLQHFDRLNFPKLTSLQRILKNSRFAARLRAAVFKILNR